jgi:hypothetical protein
VGHHPQRSVLHQRAHVLWFRGRGERAGGRRGAAVRARAFRSGANWQQREPVVCMRPAASWPPTCVRTQLLHVSRMSRPVVKNAPQIAYLARAGGTAAAAQV